MRNDSSIVRYGLKKHKTGLVSVALATLFLLSPGIIQAEEVDEESAVETVNYDESHTLDDSDQSQSVYSKNHINDLNDYRAENGKAPLVEQDDLNDFAKWKIDAIGEEMPTIDDIKAFIENGGNTHEFNGRTVTQQYEDFYGHAPEGLLGENVAYFKNKPGTDTSDGLSDAAMDTWTNSPGHDSNMKEDIYGSVGSAYYMGDNGTYYTVQVFETGEREVVEVAPEDIPENEVVEEAPEPEVEPEVETDTGAEEVVPAEPEVEEPVAPEPETDAEPEVEVTEPETDPSNESNETEIEVVEPVEEDVPVAPEPENKPNVENETDVQAEPEVNSPVEPEAEESETEPEPTPEPETKESPEDVTVEEETNEVEESAPSVDEEASDDNEEEPVVENAETEDAAADTEAVGSTVKSETDESAPAKAVKAVKTPAETVESDSEMVAETPDTPVTPVESDDATLAVEGDNGSDDSEIAPQDTPVSDKIESSDEIAPVVEESVETNTLVDETAVNADENSENEQMLPNTGVADQTMPVIFGSLLAFFGGTAFWLTRKRKAKNK